MITKQPTIEDIYNFDAFINTPGVRQGLLERAGDGDPELSVEDTDDGQAVYYTAPHGEVFPVGRPIQLAMGGRGAGKGSDLTMSDAGTALFDSAAGVARGAAAQTLGLGGDLESLYNGLKSVFNRPEDQDRIDAFLSGLKQPTALPTTERMGQILPPVVPAGAPNADMRQKSADYGQAFGELAPLPGAIDAGVAGIKAGSKALAPKAGEMILNGMEKLGTPVQMNAVPPGPNVVSTRLPTAVKATEDPLASKLNIDLQASKADPEAFAHNVSLVKQYPNTATKARTPDKVADDFINGVKDNLLYVYDKVPETTRERSKLWYDGARAITDRFSSDFGVPDQAVSGVLAVLSPQKDWFMNVSLGQRVLDIMTTKQSAKWDGSMDDIASVIWSKPQYAPMVDAIRGKTLEQITDPGLKAMWLRTYDQAHLPREHQVVSPEGDFVGLRMNSDGKTPTKTGWGSLNEIGKAVVILENPTLENISKNLGQQHKVRNFYNNIYAPNDPAGHVTIDTHAVAAGLLRPLSGNSREVLHNFGSGVVGEGGPKNSSVTGVQGTYGLYAEAYRRAAEERGVLPREMQSITWEAVRGLFPDTFKSQAKNVQQIDNIWIKYKKGQLSLDEARNEVFRAAGGINPPEWEGTGLRPSTSAEVQPPSDKR